MILIIGTGFIAEQYISCLIKFQLQFEVVGNTKEKAKFISNKYNINCYDDGIEKFKFNNNYENIIIATPIQFLFEHLKICINNCKELKNILIEKPGCLYIYQLKYIIEIKKDINIYIAYNRRFYSSTIKGLDIIKDDKIKYLKLNIDERNFNKLDNTGIDEINQNYFTAMTTHVIDMAFFICGIPETINAYVDGFGELEFHKRSSIFKGNGITKNNVKFEYEGTWTKNGKWKIELYLESGKILVYQPLEQLKIIDLNKTEIFLPIDIVDKEFKPGFYYQIKSFLNDKKNLLNINDHYDNLSIYHKIVNYNSKYNILLVGCGNIGFRHLEALSNIDLPLNIYIVEINSNNIKRAKNLLNEKKINYEIINNINEIKANYFDICIIATCSDIRLSIIKNIMDNSNIKYISNIVLEKVCFQNLKQFNEYEKIIKKYKNTKTYISSPWNLFYSYKNLSRLNNPKIKITCPNLLSNLIHIIIYLKKLSFNLELKVNKNYKIINSKRENFKEIIGNFYNDNILITIPDEKNKISMEFIENNKKILITDNDYNITFKYFEDNKLIEEINNGNSYVSSCYKDEYKNLLLYKKTNLCDYNLGLESHKIIFNIYKNIFDSEIFPIT